MSDKVGVQDKIDKLLYDMSAVISLLHIVQEGMSTGHTDTEESAKAVYAVYCLMDGIRNEINNVAEEMNKGIKLISVEDYLENIRKRMNLLIDN